MWKRIRDRHNCYVSILSMSMSQCNQERINNVVIVKHETIHYKNQTAEVQTFLLCNTHQGKILNLRLCSFSLQYVCTACRKAFASFGVFTSLSIGAILIPITSPLSLKNHLSIYQSLPTAYPLKTLLRHRVAPPVLRLLELQERVLQLLQ